MYEFNTTLGVSFGVAEQLLREALMAEGLGIVSEVDVQAIFRSKLDKEMPGYRIYGACNPRLADRVLGAQPNAGVLLPCNVVLRELAAEQTLVSFMDPGSVLGLAEDPELQSVAAEATAMLQRVVARLS